MKTVMITDNTIDVPSLTDQLEDKSCGALVTFHGRVRNHHNGRPVSSLIYQAYDAMAVKIMHQIAEKIKQQRNVDRILVVHRKGHLFPGDVAVWIGVISPHRQEAFSACHALIDEIKRDAPIWKHEFYADGSQEWVGCSHHR